MLFSPLLKGGRSCSSYPQAGEAGTSLEIWGRDAGPGRYVNILALWVTPAQRLLLLKLDFGVWGLRKANDISVPEQNLARWREQNENIRQMGLEA